jgi:hypothetical protein
MNISYKVESIGEIQKKAVQLAFVLDEESWTVWISRSGHEAIIREAGLDKCNCRGGWIRPRDGLISGNSGLLGGVKYTDMLQIADAMGKFLGVQFRLEGCVP